jgi:hypothetical protein
MASSNVRRPHDITCTYWPNAQTAFLMKRHWHNQKLTKRRFFLKNTAPIKKRVLRAGFRLRKLESQHIAVHPIHGDPYVSLSKTVRVVFTAIVFRRLEPNQGICPDSYLGARCIKGFAVDMYNIVTLCISEITPNETDGFSSDSVSRFKGRQHVVDKRIEAHLSRLGHADLINKVCVTSSRGWQNG